MKLYFHPASTTSRPVVLFAAESRIPLHLQIVDLFAGEHCQEPYASINPNRLVPVLEDGEFTLTESSAILKYLADKVSSPAYPTDLRQRARVNERMDWVNTQLNRDLCYGLVYPQIFPLHKRPSEEAQRVQLLWGRERAQGWLKVLDSHVLRPGQPWLCGDTLTLADYFGAPFVHTAELAGSDLSAYPLVRGWLQRMKALPNWKPTFETIEGYGATLKGQPLVGV